MRICTGPLKLPDHITASDKANSEVGRLSLVGEKYKKPPVEAGMQTFQ